MKYPSATAALLALYIRCLASFRPLGFVCSVLALGSSLASEIVPIGSRLELFVDGYLVDRMEGPAELRLHHPTPREIVLVHDQPWEGNITTFHTTFKDGDRYRMYYSGAHYEFDAAAPVVDGNTDVTDHPEVLAYAESTDGIHWERPALGLYEFRGSRQNNISLPRAMLDGVPVNVNCPVVFKDDNPDAPSDSRYKGVFVRANPHGILAFKSPDGLRWSFIRRDPIIIEDVFDSQNVAFWDTIRGEYRIYWRYWAEPLTPEEKRWRPPGYRGVRTTTSKDFINWSEPRDLRYVDSPLEHLYTFQVKPYHRAPHIFIGFPVRYIDRGWSDALRALPQLEHRTTRARKLERMATAVTESLLMASRNGVTFKRWNEAFIRPGIERPETWAYGNQFVSWHALETKSDLEGAPNELSLYATEGYWTGKHSCLRRYTLRLDGFVSVHAPMSGGEIITKTVVFQGDNLSLNFSTSAAGSVRVEIQDSEGRPLPGLTLDECPPLYGDAIARRVTWNPTVEGAFTLSSLENIPVRVRFVLADADLYSFRFSK